MTARRLTALIYILLIGASLAHIAVNIYAALGHDIAAIRYFFLGFRHTLTHNGVLTDYLVSGVHATYLSLPLTCLALVLIFSQRNRHAMYYADHMKWQLNSLLIYAGLMLALWGVMLLFPFVFVALLSIMPHLVYVPALLLELWLLYRMVRGAWCLHQGQSVYFNGAPMP